MATPARTRFVPYASTPGRALGQAVADITVVLWCVLWYWVGKLVHTAISAFATVGQKVESGANGIAGNLDSAGQGAGKVPLVGDPVSKPLQAAGNAARSIAEAGHGLYDKATWLAIVLALAVAVPPALAVVVPWLWARLRFARRAGAAVTLASTEAGEELLALRALANRPLPKLVKVSHDPVQAWREGDEAVIRALASMELRSAGLAVPRSWKKAVSSSS
ncbi:hypothetical protein ACIB24_19965 [Spongisporangium articulatum]|uniref:Transmembrane protein n=1 Tax=Spongisporangium articulatum TaxID=3362603 RepID=A0ABW8ASH1_9ACTN